MMLLYKYIYIYISRTSAVSSTNFWSILIFASCVVGTCIFVIVFTRAPLRGRLTPPATLAQGRIQLNVKVAKQREEAKDLVHLAI